MPYHSELCRSRSIRPCPVCLVKLALAALSEIRTTELLWHSGCNSTRTRRQSHRSNFSMWKSRKCGNPPLAPSRESVKRAQYLAVGQFAITRFVDIGFNQLVLRPVLRNGWTMRCFYSSRAWHAHQKLLTGRHLNSWFTVVRCVGDALNLNIVRPRLTAKLTKATGVVRVTNNERPSVFPFKP